jgi:outer membrane receptor protein involved in Fe transport
MMGVLLLSALLQGATMTGVVHDSTGAVVPGAAVTVRDAEGERRAVTGADGRFTIEMPAAGEVELVVRAPGFAEVRRRVQATDQVDVALAPAGVFEDVTVTPTRTEQRLADTPASVRVLRAADIEQSPAVMADDVLRQIPTFSLFRRTSSLSAHPTAQGVSLRGVGPSGVSRTLVLFDGVPFNDPFGGWVHWSRVPLTTTDRIELVENPTSNLYGNYAMGGVISIATAPPSRRTLEVATQYGNKNSPKLDFFGSDVFGKLSASVDGSFFDTDGYPNVIEDERGAVDNNATVNYKNVNVKLNYTASPRVNAFFRAGYFREERNNGKHSTFDGRPEANDTSWTTVAGGVRVALPDDSDLQAHIFGDFETFRSSFLAVPPANPPRSVGRTSLNQEVPTDGVGGMAQWSKALTAKHLLTAGGDFRWVDGDSVEDVLDFSVGQTPVTHRVLGGTQQSTGAFVQDLFTPAPDLTVTLSVRVDYWKNYDGHNLETVVATGQPTANNRLLEDRSDTVASPRVAAMYRVTDRASVWGDLAWGFRAPTLNELYREFRVGAVQTFANSELGPERLTGGELGLNLTPARDLTWRIVWFDNRVEDPISNVSQNDAGTIRQRQNLGRTRIWGLQTDAEYRIGSFWRLSGAYLYDQATVREYAADPTLVGNFLPQVPEHRGTLQVAYANPKYLTVAIQSQFVSQQYDDDRNERPLKAYALTDLQVSRQLGSNVDVFFGVQNLFDAEVIVGTNPTTIGNPLLVHGGIRVRLSGR